MKNAVLFLCILQSGNVVCLAKKNEHLSKPFRVTSGCRLNFVLMEKTQHPVGMRNNIIHCPPQTTAILSEIFHSVSYFREKLRRF